MEAALGGLEEAESVLFSSGMAALCAVLEPALGPGDVLVAVRDGYPGVRGVANDRLAPRGVEVRFVPTDTEAIVAACDGATLVWIETPSNPGLDVCDIAAVADAAHAAGGRLAVDNTLATPLGQRPLDLGADAVVLQRDEGALRPLGPRPRRRVRCAIPSGRPRCAGTARRAARSPARSRPGCCSARCRRSRCGWRARARTRSRSRGCCASTRPSRTCATRGSRSTRATRSPRARCAYAGPLVCFTLDGAERAQRFLGALELVAEATSFGGVHSSAERRARWATDDVADGFIRFSAGCEDAEDLLADVEQALAQG